MTDVLYIAGYGRSGSTLLDAMLGNHPDILGCGELELFFRDLLAGGSCTCGQPYEACELWGEVLADLEASIPGFDPAVVAPVLARTESTLGRYEPFARTSASTDLFGQVWSRLFESVANHAAVDLIVDSSKSSRGSSRRLFELAKRTDLEIAVVHLVRDPRAVLYSERCRGNNDLIEAERTRLRSFGGALRPLLGWTMANLAVSWTDARARSLPVLLVHYEELVSSPDATLARIGELIDKDLSSVVDLIRIGGEIEAGHGVRGNRMRRSGPIELRFDAEWIERSPRVNRMVSPMIAPVAAHYGYHGLRWPRTATAGGAGG